MALVNALLVRWAGGYHVVEDAASIAAFDRREGFLSLGAAQSVEEVERAGAAVLAQWGSPAVTTTAGIEPIGDGDQPFEDFGVADWITVPDEAGIPTSIRVRSLSVSEDPEGNPVFAQELGSVRQEHELRLARWLQRMSDGTIGGQSLAASPPSASAGGSPQKVDPERPKLPPFSFGGGLFVDESGRWPSDVDYRLVRVVFTLTVASTAGSVIVEARKNGVALAGSAVTYAVGESGIKSVSLSVDFGRDADLLSFAVTSSGFGAQDLVATPRGA